MKFLLGDIKAVHYPPEAVPLSVAQILRPGELLAFRIVSSPGWKLPICDGNWDEKIPGRVLYEILIQAGHVVDLYIPCDKETGRPKGLVRLNGKTLKFAEGEIEYVEGDDIEMGDMDDMEDFEGFGDEDDNVKKLYIF
ncbi:hypothetical protein ZWY2020_010580 [Hordeum vulgare]|nr:hypothetical protein ZWY2020_010580 [Hordeum vulgare]